MTPKRPLAILSPEFKDYADLQVLAKRVAVHAAKSVRARRRKEPSKKATSRRFKALARIRAAAYHDDHGAGDFGPVALRVAATSARQPLKVGTVVRDLEWRAGDPKIASIRGVRWTSTCAKNNTKKGVALKLSAARV